MYPFQIENESGIVEVIDAFYGVFDGAKLFLQKRQVEFRSWGISQGVNYFVYTIGANGPQNRGFKVSREQYDAIASYVDQD